MKQRIKMVLASLGIIAGVLFPAMVPATTHAIDPFGGCSGNTQSKVCQAKGTDSVTKIMKSVINILLYIIGIVSVILIIVGGLKYITSAGDSNGVNSAKNTILYSVVGLVIAIMAYAIVNFVLGYF
jgi:hypothetical protein